MSGLYSRARAEASSATTSPVGEPFDGSRPVSFSLCPKTRHPPCRSVARGMFFMPLYQTDVKLYQIGCRDTWRGAGFQPASTLASVGGHRLKIGAPLQAFHPFATDASRPPLATIFFWRSLRRVATTKVVLRVVFWMTRRPSPSTASARPSASKTSPGSMAS